MRRNVVAQSGECSECGKPIYKAAPWQKWMEKDTTSEICLHGKPHKLKPFKED